MIESFINMLISVFYIFHLGDSEKLTLTLIYWEKKKD